MKKKQPKSEVNTELLRASYGNSQSRYDKHLSDITKIIAKCKCDDQTAMDMRCQKAEACKFCIRAGCMEKQLESEENLQNIRMMIAHLKAYDMFYPEDYLLPAPDNIPNCQQMEGRIVRFEECVREKFNLSFFLYKDLFSYPTNKTGSINASPYETRLRLYSVLVQTLPEFYRENYLDLGRINRIYYASLNASYLIPNFFKIIYGTVQTHNWNIYFNGLHPIMISKILNRYNESKSCSVEELFAAFGINSTLAFEQMDYYEVKNMDFFKYNPPKKDAIEKFVRKAKNKRLYPVVYKFAERLL